MLHLCGVGFGPRVSRKTSSLSPARAPRAIDSGAQNEAAKLGEDLDEGAWKVMLATLWKTDMAVVHKLGVLILGVLRIRPLLSVYWGP